MFSNPLCNVLVGLLYVSHANSHTLDDKISLSEPERIVICSHHTKALQSN